MTKSFCNRCGGEIVRKRGDLVKYEASVYKITEHRDGKTDTKQEFLEEWCKPCFEERLGAMSGPIARG
jgi:hypothetical protein